MRAAVALALGAMLGWAGPFSGQPPLDLLTRVLFWMGLVLIGLLAAMGSARVVDPSSVWAKSVPLRNLLVAATSAAPMTFLAAWAVGFVRPGHVFRPQDLPALFAIVAAVQLMLTLVVLSKPPQAAPSAGEPPAPGYPAALLARLPARLGAEILALESEDHYVRVHTSQGSDLVLMRLSDAVAMLDPELGVQAHRRWWVATAAVAAVEQKGAQLRLQLANGLTVPVGRTYLAAIRARIPAT
jgi:hypothetical protein